MHTGSCGHCCMPVWKCLYEVHTSFVGCAYFKQNITAFEQRTPENMGRAKTLAHELPSTDARGVAKKRNEKKT